MREIQLRDAKANLSALVDEAMRGKPAVITRHGKAVAEISPPSPQRRQIQWGAMRDRIKLRPGWDDPVDLDRFLAGGL